MVEKNEQKNIRYIDADIYSHICDISAFDVHYITDSGIQKRGRGNPRSRKHIDYMNIISSFDIETSRIKEIEQAIMYIWQWCFWKSETDYKIVIGRTWDDFLYFCAEIKKALPDGAKLLVFDHNLSYEFQFFRGIYKFHPEEVFALESRRVLKCELLESLEFRCSYIQTNMSLDMFTEKMQVKHGKLTGTLDYTKLRYPYTELTREELAYCVNDVLGLCEAIYTEMTHDGDNLYTIPLTSTGYVRRDAKRAMREVGKRYIADQLPDYKLYTLLREAFRGGNTHANRYYADIKLTSDTVGPIHSADRASAYPAEQCTADFPVSRFFSVQEERWTYDYLMHLITERHRACIFRVTFMGIRLHDNRWGCPYLAVSKCRNIVHEIRDNGRILSADYLETTITDVDYSIIAEEYDWQDMKISDLYHARYGKLPEPLTDCTKRYYTAKTTMKGVVGQEIFYMKSKNKLNSIYGMSAQDPVKESILFNKDDSNDFEVDTSISPADLLVESNRRAFQPYQWGVWVTAWARYHLEQGIKIAGDGFLYCDTDSVKYVGNADFTRHNAERIKAAKEAGAFAVDPKGRTHYMGVFEQEDDMTEFKTLGAKKYAYRDLSGKLHITVAGVSKKKGAEELEKAGGLDAFKEGFIFRDAGGSELVYNDDPQIKEYRTPDGVTLPITANVVIRDSTYELGLTADYKRLLYNSRMIPLDNE